MGNECDFRSAISKYEIFTEYNFDRYIEFSEIERILQIEDDDEYKEMILDLFKDSSYDENGNPQDIKMFNSHFFELISRYSYDKSIITEYYDKFCFYRLPQEEYFICLSDYIDEIVRRMDKSKVHYMDFTVSEIYSLAEGIFDIDDNENKRELKEVLIGVMGKYPNFEYTGNGYRINNPNITNEKDKLDEDDSDKYHIRSNKPFYLKEDDFFGEKSLFKKFLDETEKVAIAPDMILLPFFCLKTYYYLTIENSSEQITVDTVTTGFKHINRQSNLYYQVRSAITKELREDYDEFEHYFLKDLRKAVGINNRILKKIYADPNKLLKSKYLYVPQTLQ